MSIKQLEHAQQTLTPTLRRRARPPLARHDRLALAALAVVLLVGLGLRLALVIARPPAFLGIADSYVYMTASDGDVFAPAVWPAGYPFFLWALHALIPSLTFTILVQHALAMGAAVLWFLSVRRVAPGGWGLIPAAVVLLAGPQLLYEHAPVSEALFTPLVAATCYCAVRALDEQRPRWAVALGTVAVAAGCVRSVGVTLALLAVVWLAVCKPGTRKHKLVAGGFAALGAWVLLASYIAVARHELGYVGPGLTRAAGWNFYARVAPFADCERFTPPRLTRAFCEVSSADVRPPPPAYLEPSSPAARVIGSWEATRPAQNRALVSFARRAIVHQPLDYLQAVGRDLTRYWSSDIDYRFLAGDSYDVFSRRVGSHDTYPDNLGYVARRYATGHTLGPAGVPGGLAAYEHHTRLEGPLLAVLVALALAGIPLARGRPLAAGIFLGGVAAVLLITPVAAATYASEYAIPAYGPLAAAAAIGVATLAGRFGPRLAARRS